MTSGGLLGVWGKWVKHAKYIYNIQDFNPEQVLAVGYTKSKFITDAIVIFFNGLWSTGFVNGKPIYRITEKHNWNLLLATLRAHGESGGEYSTFGALEKYDCRDWVSWARKRFGTESLIFLMGISMGGAMELPYATIGKCIDALLGEELMSLETVQLIGQVSQITSRIIHGEKMEKQYLDIVEGVYPQIIKELKLCENRIVGRCGSIEK